MYHPFIPSITEELWQRNSQPSYDSSMNSILDHTYPNSKNLAKFNVSILIDLKKIILKKFTTDAFLKGYFGLGKNHNSNKSCSASTWRVYSIKTCSSSAIIFFTS